MRYFWIATVSLAWACSAQHLDRSKATALLESKPWGSSQGIRFSNDQVSCGVAARLWDFHPAVYAGPLYSTRAYWEPTTEGQRLGLAHMVDDPSARLGPGFRVSVTVTGIAAEGEGSARAVVEATVLAKIAHHCFTTGVPFEDGRVKIVFARFDDGWRVVGPSERGLFR